MAGLERAAFFLSMSQEQHRMNENKAHIRCFMNEYARRDHKSLDEKLQPSENGCGLNELDRSGGRHVVQMVRMNRLCISWEVSLNSLE